MTKLNETKSPTLLSTVQSRVNLFYILAFVPILLVFFYSPFSAIIPFYGFLLIMLKYQKLSEFEGASLLQKILGVIVIACSFFVYYGVVLVYPQAVFYSPANYTAYLLGLFLIFFEFSTLKEAFAPLFLIVAATSSSFISVWLKPFIAPFSNDFAHIIVNILNALGINARLYYIGNIPIVTFSSISGKLVSGAFVYECIGVYSALVFSIILIVILFEDSSSLKVKIAFSIAGLLGTFALNVLRVTTIFLVDYFYGIEWGGTVHYIIGYVLFSTWLACFFYVYAKRRTLHANLIAFWKKIHRY